MTCLNILSWKKASETTDKFFQSSQTVVCFPEYQNCTVNINEILFLLFPIYNKVWWRFHVTNSKKCIHTYQTYQFMRMPHHTNTDGPPPSSVILAISLPFPLCSPSSCHVCDFQTELNAQFVSHMSLHVDKEQWMFSLCCSVCDYACMEETDMKNHISTGHAGTEPPPAPTTYEGVPHLHMLMECACGPQTISFSLFLLCLVGWFVYPWHENSKNSLFQPTFFLKKKFYSCL